MKKVLFLAIGLMLITSLAVAEEAKDTNTASAQPAETIPAPAAPAEVTPTVETVALPPAPAVPETVVLKGEIIDNLCASSQKPEDLAKFIKRHTKQCAIKPACAASGYSIYADGKLSKFDKDSSAKVEQFLKDAKSKLLVVVEAKKTGDELSLGSIKNQ